MSNAVTMHHAPWAAGSEAVLDALGSDSERGLSAAEAQKRLAQFGPNALHEAKRRSRLLAFLMQFADWMIGLLAVAAAVSASIGEWPDALLIAAIVLANGIIGYVQEQKAEQAVAALKKLTQPTARVWRDGKLSEVKADEVVPGDLVELRGGDLSPADGRVIAATELQADESPLTGESMPVDKETEPLPERAPLPDRTNMVFAGTAVTHGIGKVVITGTGMQTELGKIAALLESTEVGKTPLQERLKAFSKRLAAAVVAVCLLVFTIGLIRGDESPQQMFLVAVSLAVAAIPEGLPAAITIALALGSQRMSRRKAIVRQLSAVETLGSVNVICSDKTGTLTQNKMSVSDWTPHREDPPLREELIRAAVLCNDAQFSADGQLVGSATESAMLASAAESNVDVQQLRKQWPRITEFPFESKRKRMSALHQTPDGQQVIYVKGAAETILELSTHLFDENVVRPLSHEDQQRLHAALNELASRGRRVLAVARRSWQGDSPPASAEDVESELALVGLIGIVDPPRPEARDAIARCRTAGIRPVMITGDHQVTAVAIAKELALWDDAANVVDGATLEGLGDDELRKRALSTTVFARVSPEHKLRIVRAFQSHGCVVSMTGDGVNDAPALKQADIGVAMGITGTDVSKEAARMVLADDNFATIVAAVEEGRVVYDNIRKFVQYLLTANLSEILLVLSAIVCGLPLPLLPVQLLWINLVTDGLPALALAYERADEHLMQRRPRRRDESIFTDGLARDIIIFGTLMAAACLGLYAYFLLWQPRESEPLANEAYARTATFVALAMFQLWYVLGLRSQSRSILRSPPWENWRMMGAFLTGAVLQILIVYLPFLQPFFHTVPLRPLDLLLSVGCSTMVLLVFELTKPLRMSNVPSLRRGRNQIACRSDPGPNARVDGPR